MKHNHTHHIISFDPVRQVRQGVLFPHYNTSLPSRGLHVFVPILTQLFTNKSLFI